MNFEEGTIVYLSFCRPFQPQLRLQGQVQKSLVSTLSVLPLLPLDHEAFTQVSAALQPNISSLIDNPGFYYSILTYRMQLPGNLVLSNSTAI